MSPLGLSQKLLSFKLNKKALYILAGLFYAISGQAQIAEFTKDSSRVYRNEIGIDITNFLTFIQQNNQSLLVNYKRYFPNQSGLRSGITLDIASVQGDNINLAARVGYELGRQMNHWRLFYGFDAAGAYVKSNIQPNYNYNFGVEPLIGGKYYFSKNFSVSSEVKLNFLWYFYRNPTSFDPTANFNSHEVNIGSVGMLVFNFHF